MQQKITAADEKSRLRYQRCRWCTSVQLRPVGVCRVCRGDRFRWEESAGLGRVVISPTQTRKQGAFPRLTTIQLDEGPLVEGWIRGGMQEQLWVGARVRVSTTKDSSGRPVFELAPADSVALRDVSEQPGP